MKLVGVFYCIFSLPFVYALAQNLGTASNSRYPSLFTLPAKGWASVGHVTVALSKPHAVTTSPGDGILVHASGLDGRSDVLETTSAYGDIELELSYLLAEGAEATLYLHGIYPVTLADSREVTTPTAQSNGGAAGYPPRQQVGRAPGLWQQLHVQFKSPRFDSGGHEIAPARLLQVELNGVTIHEDVQLQTPEKGGGKAEAPLRFAVVRGAVALKDITIDDLPELADSRDRNGVDPILVAAQVNTMLRSFMDVPGGPRVVHAISVGHPDGVHYTYDLDKGSLFQVWRGGFLDATPMWNNRGNGTSRILGSLTHFGVPSLAVGRLADIGDPWPADTTGTGYKPKGYVLDAHDLPTFRYVIYGQQVTDAIRPLANSEGFTRSIAVTCDSDDLYLRLAIAPTIVDQGKGVFLIGDNKWYLRIEEAGKAKPFVREQPTGKELLVPVTSAIRYSIIF